MAVHTDNPLDIESFAFSKPGHQFWTLQIGGWLGYALIVYFAIIHPQTSDPAFSFVRQVLNLAVETLVGFSLSYIQWRFIRRVVQFPLRVTLALSFLSAAVLGFIYNVIKLGSYKVIVFGQHWYEAWSMLEFGGWLLFSLATMLVWTSIFFIMLYNTKLQKEHAMLLRAQTAAKDAQLQMLTYQLNPHFMFNTMNAISTLIFKHENDKANEMLDKLCEFFRYSLDKNTKARTTMLKEINVLDLYLSIEKVRFSERLNVEIDIPESVLSAKIPSMLLQPLVENAIKYTVEPRKEKATVKITAQLDASRLIIRVIDDGHGMGDKVSSGLGIGLNNTRLRLDAMFNGDYSIDIKTNSAGGTTVEISVPFETVTSNTTLSND